MAIDKTVDKNIRHELDVSNRSLCWILLYDFKTYTKKSNVIFNDLCDSIMFTHTHTHEHNTVTTYNNVYPSALRLPAAVEALSSEQYVLLSATTTQQR